MLGDDAFGLFWGPQSRVISTPYGWSLTQLPDLSRTHVLIYCRSRKSSHALQMVLPKPLQTFVPRMCPTISTRVFSSMRTGYEKSENLLVGLQTQFPRFFCNPRAWKFLLSCRGSGLKSSPPPFSMQTAIASMSLGRVSFFPGVRNNSTAVPSQHLGRS